MKKLIIITGVILIVYLVGMTMVAQPASAPSAKTSSSGETAAYSGYLIGISEERVTVFKDGKPYIRTDTQISDLPKSDQARLEEGVRIDSLKELKEKLQDYCS